ncbi:biotin carboxylase [Streptomyces sp. NPDC006132]|uniref:biotin carboxylase n=1 Tax=Streptomyces sp. NPDC006132 TaxID=3156732 RepID=UPI0033FE3FD8
MTCSAPRGAAAEGPRGGPAGESVVVIVDGYGTARHLPALFGERGHACVHVRSGQEVPEHLLARFRPEAYRELIVGDGTLGRILPAVAAHRPVALVAGSPGAAGVADALAQALRLRGNDTRLGEVRRDRYRMADALRTAGLRTPRQLLVSDLAGLLAWYAGVGGRVILETLGGTGCGPARRIPCATEHDLVAAFRGLVGAAPEPAGPAAALLARECPPRGRYHVNTVSLDGTHHVCDIWQVRPPDRDAAPGLSRGVLLSRRGPEQDALVLHTLAALDILGLRHGPAHTELALTPQGPCVLTVGAHLSGGDLPLLVAGAVGSGQLEWTVDASVAPQRFFRRAARDYRRTRSAAFVRADEGPARPPVRMSGCSSNSSVRPSSTRST